jgi:phage-related minor tail protein
VVLAEAALEVGVDLGDLRSDVQREVNSAFRGINAEALGRGVGEDLGNGITRGADGRLRNARPQFTSAGETLGVGFGEGVTRGADGKLRDARGQLVKTGEGAGQGFGDGFERTSKSAAKKSGDGFSKSLGTALKGGIAGVAVAAAGALTVGFLGALEKEKQVDRITASLALTDKQSKKAGEVAGNLYAGAWGGSMEEVTVAVESVISSIDGMAKASTSELESVTASILDISTAFDIDVTEAARNAGILMKTGLAGDAQEAADLMTRSLQEVPVALRGEISDATQEYSQFFAELGIGGPEAMGLLVSSLDAGQFGVDKMGDAIKEFTLRATDLGHTGAQEAMEELGLNSEKTASQLLGGGDAARDAFLKIIKGLQGIEDPAEQAEAAIELFGTPLEDLGKGQIPDFLASLNLTEVALQDVEGAAESMGDTLNDNVATRLEALKRGAETLLTEGIGALFTAFDQGKESVTALGDVFQGTIEAFQPVRDTLIELAQAAQERLAPVFEEVGGKIRDELLPALNEFGEAMAPIVDFIVKQVGPRVIGTFESVGFILGGLVDIVTGVFGAIAALIKGDWSGAWENAQKIFKGFGGILKGLLNQILVQFGNSFNTMFQDAARVGTRIREFVTARIREMGIGIRNIIGNLPQFFSIAGSNMLRGLVRALVPAPVREKIRSIVDTIKNLLKIDLTSAGKTILLSLARGMISGLSSVAQQAANAAATIRSYFPFSPAKVGPLSGSGSPENSGLKIAEMISDGLSLGASGISNTLNSELQPLSANSSMSPLSRFPRASPSPQATRTAQVASREVAPVNVQQIFTGPTTSGGRLQEMNWNIRYATQSRREIVGGVPAA